VTSEPLVQRKDDNAETLKNRLKAFHAQTKAVSTLHRIALQYILPMSLHYVTPHCLLDPT
jgi:adenylate kinase